MFPSSGFGSGVLDGVEVGTEVVEDVLVVDDDGRILSCHVVLVCRVVVEVVEVVEVVVLVEVVVVVRWVLVVEVVVEVGVDFVVVG